MSKKDEFDEFVEIASAAWKVGILKIAEHARISNLEAENAELKKKLEKYEVEEKIKALQTELKEYALKATFLYNKFSAKER